MLITLINKYGLRPHCQQYGVLLHSNPTFLSFLPPHLFTIYFICSYVHVKAELLELCDLCELRLLTLIITH